LGVVLARPSVSMSWVGDDRGEGRPGTTVAGRGTRHVSHLDTEIVGRCVRWPIVAEGRNLRPNERWQPGGYERTTRHDKRMERRLLSE
jgi:hypothetical protein